MTFKTLAAAGCATALVLSGATPAFAQAPAPATTAAPAVTHGPAVPGVCTVSVEAVLGNSTVGKYVQTRLQQLLAQVNAELNAERSAIETDAKALEGQRTALDQNTLEQRGSAIQVRANALQRKAQQREREIQVTEQKAFSRVGEEMEPLIRQAYQQKSCSILINRQSIVMNLANPASDLTPQVVTALNAKITQFAFERERLDQTAAPRPAAGAAPAAARPATPAPATTQAPRR